MGVEPGVEFADFGLQLTDEFGQFGALRAARGGCRQCVTHALHYRTIVGETDRRARIS
jgi:hypothetical protein